MSYIAYNNIQLPYSSTTRFIQRALRDESDTDWFLTQFDISTTCTINTNYLSVLAPDLVGLASNPAQIMSIIYARLMKHRQKLSVKFNGVELIPQPPQGNVGTVDAQSGPKPESCTYFALNNTTFILSYHIIAHYWINNLGDDLVNASNRNVTLPANNQPGNQVLYNRWSETQDIDICNFSRRTRVGKFVIRSDATSPVIVDQLRKQMAVTGVPSGFLREGSHYTVDPSGLALRYQITDKQVFKMPPSPAFEADGEYTETTSTPMSVQRTGQVRVRLRGDKATSQAALVKTAIDVCCAKLAIRDADLTGQLDAAFAGWLEFGQLTVGMYENEVECVLRMKMKPLSNVDRDGRRKGLWGLRFTNMVSTPGSDPQDNPPTPKYPPWGVVSAAATPGPGQFGLLLQAAAYYDPSLTDTTLSQKTDQLTHGAPPGAAGGISESLFP